VVAEVVPFDDFDDNSVQYSLEKIFDKGSSVHQNTMT